MAVALTQEKATSIPPAQNLRYINVKNLEPLQKGILK